MIGVLMLVAGAALGGVAIGIIITTRIHRADRLWRAWRAK